MDIFIIHIICNNVFESRFQFILFYPSSFPLSFVNHAFTYYSDASYYIQLIVGKNTNKTKKREEEEEEGREMRGERKGERFLG